MLEPASNWATFADAAKAPATTSTTPGVSAASATVFATAAPLAWEF